MWGTTERKCLSESQEERLHQKLNWLGTWSWFSTFQNCGKINLYCLSHLVYDILLMQPEQSSLSALLITNLSVCLLLLTEFFINQLNFFLPYLIMHEYIQNRTENVLYCFLFLTLSLRNFLFLGLGW